MSGSTWAVLGGCAVLLLLVAVAAVGLLLVGTTSTTTGPRPGFVAPPAVREVGGALPSVQPGGGSAVGSNVGSNVGESGRDNDSDSDLAGKFEAAFAIAVAARDFETAQRVLDQAAALAVTDEHRARCKEQQLVVERHGFYVARVAAAEAVARRNPAYARTVYGEAQDLAITPAQVAHCKERQQQLADEITRRASYGEHLLKARAALDQRDLARARQATDAAGKLATTARERSECEELLAEIVHRDHFETELAKARALLQQDPDGALEILGGIITNEPTEADGQRVDKLMSHARKRLAFDGKWKAARAAADGGDLTRARSLYGEAERLAPSDADRARCRKAVAALETQ